MPRDDFEGASTASTSSATSTVSTIWSIVQAASSHKITQSLDDLCSYLRATTDVEHSPIGELIIRKEKDAVGHEFLSCQSHLSSINVNCECSNASSTATFWMSACGHERKKQHN